MTIRAARLPGVDKQRGTIAPKMFTGMIAVPGNPLEDIEALKKVNFVMKNGKIIKRREN
jgi:imidazolonepropionase-like amidohydrolase